MTSMATSNGFKNGGKPKNIDVSATSYPKLGTKFKYRQMLFIHVKHMQINIYESIKM